MRKFSITLLTTLVILSLPYAASASNDDHQEDSKKKAATKTRTTTKDIRRGQREAARQQSELSTSTLFTEMRTAVTGSPQTMKTLRTKFSHLDSGKSLAFGSEPSVDEKAITTVKGSLVKTETKVGTYDESTADVKFRELIQELKEKMIPNGEDTYARIEGMVGTIPEGETESVKNLAKYIDRLHSVEKGEELDNIEESFYDAAQPILGTMEGFSIKGYKAAITRIAELKKELVRSPEKVRPQLEEAERNLASMLQEFKQHKQAITVLESARESLREYEGVGHYQDQVKYILEDYQQIMKIDWTNV